jgi:anti-anti-sigma factor
VEGAVLYKIHTSQDATVVRCSGRMVQGDGPDGLLRAVMSQDCRSIQVDLSKVSCIDANGLGALAALETWARKGDRHIVLLNPSERCREALEKTRLISVLQVRWTAANRRVA